MDAKRRVAFFGGSVSPVDVLRRFWIVARMVSRLGLYSLPGVWLSGPWAVYANLQPRYRLVDRVPDGEQAVAASHRLKLNGANLINALIEVPQGKSLHDPETLAAIAECARHRESS
jgi:hypothetical protein